MSVPPVGAGIHAAGGGSIHWQVFLLKIGKLGHVYRLDATLYWTADIIHAAAPDSSQLTAGVPPSSRCGLPPLCRCVGS